jgi:outer membrane biosynthesis protein TonB
MKKIIISFAFLTLLSGVAFAQKQKPEPKPKPEPKAKPAPKEKPAPKVKVAKGEEPIQMSKPFEEPEFWTKLLQMQSGYTLLFEVSDRDGMKLTTFNEKHAGGAAKPVPLKTVIKKMQYTDVLGIYEIKLYCLFNNSRNQIRS